jgi:ABC-type branched-subunit amino acid transport system substrate-binding protein
MKFFIKIGAVVGASSLLVASCASGSEQSAASGSSASGDIVFGQLLGITGDYASFSPPAIEAAKIAVAEINEAGGIMGRDVKLVSEDNRTSVDGAVSGFSKLASVSKISVLGSLESDGQVALFDEIEKRQIPNICSSCGTTFLDEKGGNYSFRVTASDSDAGIIVAQVARDEGHGSMAMIVQNTEGASGPAEVAKDAFEKAGGTVTTVSVEPGASSYNSEVAKAFADDPDVLYLAAGVESGLPILREIDRRGYDVPIFVSPDLITEDVAALDNASSFFSALTAFDTESPAYQSYATRYEEETGDQPESGMYDANNYDQYILFALAMEAAQSTAGKDVAGKIIDVASAPGTKVYSYADGLKALKAGEEIDFDGASSSLDMNEFGNLVSPVLGVLAVQDGAWETTREVEIDATLRP